MKLFSRTIGLFEIALLLVLIIIYHYFTFIVDSDIPDHAKFIRQYATGHSPFPVNFLYYFTVYLVSFFSADIAVLSALSVYVLAVVTFLKYVIVKKIIYSELSNSFNNMEMLSSLTSFSLLFLFSLPSILLFKGQYYMFSSPPNVWHNSTTIFVMPFVILLFWISLKQLKDFKKNRLLFITILIVLNVLVKPSFLFVYLLAYPILLFKQYLFSKLFWINLTPIVCAFLLIIIEYYFIYIVPTTADKSAVGIQLFYLINARYANGDWLYITTILISTIVSSFLFPIVLLSRNRKLFKEEMVQFAIICIVFGLIICNTFYETGIRAMHGNLYWQNVMCSFLLFFVCILQLLKLIAVNPLRWKAYQIEISIFALHFLSGILYFLKIIVTTSYG